MTSIVYKPMTDIEYKSTRHTMYVQSLVEQLHNRYELMTSLPTLMWLGGLTSEGWCLLEHRRVSVSSSLSLLSFHNQQTISAVKYALIIQQTISCRELLFVWGIFSAKDLSIFTVEQTEHHCTDPVSLQTFTCVISMMSQTQPGVAGCYCIMEAG